MAMPAVTRDLASWRALESSRVIDYSITVLTQIDKDVIAGFNRFRRGGIEVGGILFGVQTGERVTIEAFRPILCEHALGPSFELSEKDHQSFQAILDSAPTDESLRGLIPVGWYCSHTRSSISLVKRDLELFDRYFPEPWQIALVLKPDTFKPTQAGFFFRETDGSIRSESSYQEFDLPLRREVVEKKDARTPAASPPAAVPIARSVRTLWPPIAAKWKLLLLGAAVGILILLGSRITGVGRSSRGAAVKRSLTLQDRDGQLRIVWNGAAAAETGPQDAWLEILDGSLKSRIALRADEIRSGSVVYTRTTEHVSVHMQVGSAEEWATFIGSPPAHPRPTPAPPQHADRGANTAELKLQQQAAQITRLQEMVNALNRSKPAVAEAKPPAPRKAAARAYVPPARTKSGGVVQTLEPPAIDLPAAALPTVRVARSFSAPPAPSVPIRTGTLIWTGRLSRKATITIDGNQPSSGALTGEIPGFPVRLRVYPGNLTAEGLTLFATESNRPARFLESPGPQNGWNKTFYMTDNERARAVSILEAPAASNSWKRIVLRGDEPAVAVIVIVWDRI